MQETPEVATGQSSLASPYTDKRGYAKRWAVSTRTIDNLIAAGMPRLKIGARRVRLCVAECDEWMTQQFRVSSRRAAKGVQ